MPDSDAPSPAPSGQLAQRVGRFAPGIGQAVDVFHRDPPTLDPDLLELCGQEIARITSGADASPTTGADDPTRQACLEFARAFCYSPQSVTDAHFAAMLEHLPPEQVLSLTVGLWISDASERLVNFCESLNIAEAAP